MDKDGVLSDTESAQDMARQKDILTKLEQDIDQLAATARDCKELAPEVMRALDLAWYFAEAALRELGISSCGHLAAPSSVRLSRQSPYCGCCAHFREIGLSTQMLRINFR